MKMDKFCMMFFVIVASIFFISGSASAQAPGDCIECSSCTLFEMWKFICTFIGQICTMQGLPANFCLEQQEICEDNIDALVTECEDICQNDCNNPVNCSGGQPDGNCTAGENCPADATDCNDTICMEPTCTNGCGEVPVSSGSTDEACNATAGCTTPPCACDGNGGCIGENEGCIGGDPDGDCEAGENCPADATDCNDTICMEPTCTNGCGETPVPVNETDEACNASAGCTTPPCSCDGQGNCATVPVSGCHGHGNPDWLELQSLPTVLAKEKGCTGNCGTEYLVELRSESHADCGDQAWVWIKDGQNMDIDKCYHAAVFENSAPCGPVIDVTPDSVSCPVCEGQMEECEIEIEFTQNGIYKVGETISGTHKFYVNGVLTDYDSIIATYHKEEGGPTYDYRGSITHTATGTYVAEGRARTDIIGSGTRIVNVEAEFGNCEEEAASSFCVYDTNPAVCGGNGSTPTCTSTNCESSNAPNIPCICGNSVTTTSYPWCCASKSYVDSTKDNCEAICSGAGECSETDDGKDYYEYGVTTLSDGTKLKDYCMTGAYEKHVMEYWCTADGHGQGNYPCPNGCENGACISGGGKWCEDTDGGKIYNKYGECTDSAGGWGGDSCYNGKLYENYCLNDACAVDGSGYTCPSGQECKNGACVASGGTCSETDDGKDYYEYGVTTLSDGTKLKDYCMTGAYEKHVMEYWCTADGHGQGNYPCPNGCENGACKP